MSAKPKSLPALFADIFSRYYHPRHLMRRYLGRWEAFSTTELAGNIRRTAYGLADWGIRKGDAVAILSASRPEWVIADLAIQSLGAVTVPVYPTQAPEVARYVVEHSACRAIFVESAELWKKYGPFISSLKGLEITVFFSSVVREPKVLALPTLWEMGDELAERHPTLFAERRDAIEAEDLATIVYTSGTTGAPKGVELTHANLLANLLAVAKRIPLHPAEDVALSYLPLSHAFERLVIYYYLQSGIRVAFAGGIETLMQDLKDVRPTVVTTVPRLLEKIYSVSITKGNSAPFLKRFLFRQAMSVAGKWKPEAEENSFSRMRLGLARSVVFRKWHEAFGGRLRCLVSGGAPLSPELGHLFAGAGIPVYQGYGLTEASPVVAVNAPGQNKLGTVGRPLDEVKVRIAEDGQLYVKGENVMRGYHKDPQATAQVKTADGWLATGDLGAIDSEGYLTISGRKKENFKTSTGEYISPAKIEQALKQSPFIEEAVVVGSGRACPAALIVPDKAFLKQYLEQKGNGTADVENFLRSQEFKERLTGSVRKINQTLLGFEKVRHFAVASESFSVDSGELTPTLKVRRSIVEERYRNLIEAAYLEPDLEAAGYSVTEKIKLSKGV
jgi:long-chain acyl-CoA synthetase